MPQKDAAAIATAVGCALIAQGNPDGIWLVAIALCFGVESSGE